jgi:hypothetical protein
MIMPNPNPNPAPSTMSVEVTCIKCQTTHHIIVPVAGYAAWRNGILIQDALPELTDDQREILLSRICGPCFDAIFHPKDRT